MTIQAWILTLRGQASRVADTLDWLEATSREAGIIDTLVTGLGTAAIARAALAQPDQATALLGEIDANPGAREDEATRLCSRAGAHCPPTGSRSSPNGSSSASKPTPRTPSTPSPPSPPLSPKPTATTRPPPPGTRMPPRWQAFGVVPEHAFARLGQGRCLVALGRTADARSRRSSRPATSSSRLQAAPALAETDASFSRRRR